MIVLIVITILFQMTISTAYGPLVSYLPLSLAERMSEIQGEQKVPGTPTTDAGSHESHDEVKVATFPPTAREEGNDMRPVDSRDNGKLIQGSGNDTPSGDEHLDVHAFDHPATYEVSFFDFDFSLFDFFL